MAFPVLRFGFIIQSVKILSMHFGILAQNHVIYNVQPSQNHHLKIIISKSIFIQIYIDYMQAAQSTCFDATQYSTDTFNPLSDGTITGIKLVHTSGSGNDYIYYMTLLFGHCV